MKNNKIEFPGHLSQLKKTVYRKRKYVLHETKNLFEKFVLVLDNL